MQAFLISKQEHNESPKDFLNRLAEGAGFSNCAECLNRDRLVVNRFAYGTRDPGLKDKIMGMRSLPSIAQVQEWCDIRGFDMLFGNNLIHVLESIFISLDYESFKRCLDVCHTWRQFLTSPSFRRLSKVKFYVDKVAQFDNLPYHRFTGKTIGN